MLRFLKLQLHRRGWEKVTYQDLLRHNVVGKLVTHQLALAAAEHATRMTYGLPPNIELSEKDKAEIMARDEESQRMVRAVDDKAHEESGHLTRLWTRDGECRFHRRDGLPEVPWWREIDGQWVRHAGILASVYPYLAQHLCERLVSLDVKPQEGGSEAWIEYTIPLEGDERKFMRVALVLELNNSITVELLESRTVRRGATVWWRHWKV